MAYVLDRRLLRRGAFAAALLIGTSAQVAAAPCTSIALVLSVDSSSSVEDREFELERRGMAQALRDPEALTAVLSSGPIKIATLFWADPAGGIWTDGWHLVGNAADAERLARRVETIPRTLGGDTGLGVGLAAALSLLSQPEACAARRIVNITGDGSESLMSTRKSAISLAAAREMARRLGVTINGLAIANEEPGIGDYYRRYVILGPNAFVMEIDDVADYAEAIKRKIMRETETMVATAELPVDKAPAAKKPGAQ